MNDLRLLLWLPFLTGIALAAAGFLRGWLVEDRKPRDTWSRVLIATGTAAVCLAIVGWSWVVASEPTFCRQCGCC